MYEPEFVSSSALKLPVQDLVKQMFDIESMKNQMKRFQVIFYTSSIKKSNRNHLKFKIKKDRCKQDATWKSVFQSN